ncbi:alpha/beta fold hydrolase [Nocardia sp. CY41]|uniref:alpha/beta fold hydrolase n=1 Tax=Nocardia sp. CY41 TaxID=2608686 RepID=UPI0019154DD9
MTTFVLVHGAWHGPWAWERVVGLLRAAGAHTVTPDISAVGDYGLHDHAAIVAAALDAVPGDEEIVLVGHSYAGLVAREAADARPEAVDHIVLVDGWAGRDGVGIRRRPRIPDPALGRAPRCDAHQTRTARRDAAGRVAHSKSRSAKSRVRKWTSGLTTSTAPPLGLSTSSVSAGPCC